MKHVLSVMLLGLCGISTASFATEPADAMATIEISLNSVWVVLAAMLVFLMQAGFALVESGMVRSKNAVNVVMKNYMDACVGGLIFWLIGYGLMFGANPTGWFGQSHFAPSDLAHWDWTFMFFQMMFAATATTIASGAMAERVHFGAYLIGACLISGLIYPVFGSWAWGSAHGGTGWLKELGFIDFAGSTVVHSIGGWVALAGIMVLGARLGRFAPDGTPRVIAGHNLGMVALGGFLLWFAWFAFNAGSTVKAGADIGLIALNTHLAACAGAVSTMLIATLRRKPILLTGTVNGSLGGLVGITAGCATMSPIFAIVTGAIAGAVVTYGPMLLEKFRLDDVVDAVSVHGFCGAWGTLAAGLFFAGDLFDLARIQVQLLGIGVGIAWGFGLSLVMYLVIDRVMGGMRADTQHEQRGLDYTEHAELGYPEFQQQALFDSDQLAARR